MPPAKGDEGVNSFLGNLKHQGGAIGVEQLRVSLLKSKDFKGRFNSFQWVRSKVYKGVRSKAFEGVRSNIIKGLRIKVVKR